MDDELGRALAIGKLPLIDSCDEHPDAGFLSEPVHEPDVPFARLIKCEICDDVVDAL